MNPALPKAYKTPLFYILLGSRYWDDIGVIVLRKVDIYLLYY